MKKNNELTQEIKRTNWLRRFDILPRLLCLLLALVLWLTVVNITGERSHSNGADPSQKTEQGA